MVEILAVILGWLLGLGTGPIAERIQKRTHVREMTFALHRELRQLRHVMGILAFRLGVRTGLLDTKFLDRIRPAIDGYDGPEDDPDGLAALRKALTLPREQLAAWSAAEAQSNRSPRVIPYGVPFFDSQIPRLGLLPLSLHERLLMFRQHLEYFNQEVTWIVSQINLTFDPSIGAQNMAAVKSNIEQGYQDLAKRAATVVEMLTGILPQLEKGAR